MTSTQVNVCPLSADSLVTLLHSGEVIGFTELGETNLHLAALERKVEGGMKTSEEPLASSMLVMMVRGLFSRLQFPYVQFPCSSLHG